MGVVDRLYPYQLFLPAEGQAAVQGILRTFNLVDAAKQVSKMRNFEIRKDVFQIYRYLLKNWRIRFEETIIIEYTDTGRFLFILRNCIRTYFGGIG